MDKLLRYDLQGNCYWVGNISLAGETWLGKPGCWNIVWLARIYCSNLGGFYLWLHTEATKCEVGVAPELTNFNCTVGLSFQICGCDARQESGNGACPVIQSMTILQ